MWASKLPSASLFPAPGKLGIYAFAIFYYHDRLYFFVSSGYNRSIMNEKHVLSIIETFNNSSIAEIDISEGNFHMVLRKDAAFNRSVQVHPVQGSHSDPALAAAVGAAAVHDAANRSPQAPIQATAQAAPQVHLGVPAAPSGNETIDSPLVGTFYSAPSPDAPPFVKSGSKVKAGDKLCILEAMKMMNNLEAEFDCEIVSVLASNGQLVEYGQALFEIKRT